MSKAPRLRPGPTWADRCCARRVLASPPLVFRRTQRLCRAASPNMLVKVTLLSLLATVAADSHPVPIDEHIPCYPASTTLNLRFDISATAAPEFSVRGPPWRAPGTSTAARASIPSFTSTRPRQDRYVDTQDRVRVAPSDLKYYQSTHRSTPSCSTTSPIGEPAPRHSLPLRTRGICAASHRTF